MPKLLGFLRSKPKVDEAAWAMAKVRTAARLGDLFTSDEAPSGPDASSDVSEDAVVDPGPWPGGPRPPIIVVGASDVVSVLAKGSEIQPTRVTGDVDSVPVDVNVGATTPIGVMARAGDVGDGTWRLPTVARPSPGFALPTAAHLFPPLPTPRQEKPAGPSAAERSSAGPSPGERSPGASSAASHAAYGRPSAGRSETGRSASGGSAAKLASRTQTGSAPVPVAYCPYCARILDPAPTASRRCDRCRQRIIVKHIDQGTVYLTEAAVQIFEAERRRVMESVRWTRDRDRWLQLASAAGAPADRQAQLAAARVSEHIVAAARMLCLTTLDRAFRTARRDHDWDEASRLRRDKAALLYRLAGSPKAPPAEVVAIFREGVAAELRGIAEISRNAELVSARCCQACRGDDRVLVRIAQELRAARLPHAGCPKGLCRCRWDLAARDRMTISRYLQRRPGVEAPVAPALAGESVQEVPTRAAVVHVDDSNVTGRASR